MTHPSAPPADTHQLMRWLHGTQAIQVLGLATRLGLPDAIGGGTRAVAGLAEGSGIPPERMVRLLRALGGMGLCTEPEPGVFGLTATGALLRQDHPRSLHGTVRLSTMSAGHEPWQYFEDSLRTGRSVFEDALGQPVFPYFANDPELSAVYDRSMSELAREAAEALPDQYDFGAFSSVTDVGGGDGTLLTAVLRRHPGLSGVVFDTSTAAEHARDTVRAAGLAERCEVTSGDFFAAVPPGSDLYLLKSVLHDWDDHRAATILRRCRAALPPHGRLLIVEPVVPDLVAAGGSADVYFSDLHMLVIYGGKERTRGEFEELCAAGGFALADVSPLPVSTGLHLIEAVPA